MARLVQRGHVGQQRGGARTTGPREDAMNELHQPAAGPAAAAPRRLRLVEPNRQAEAHLPPIWDELVAQDHVVRLFAETMRRLDLSAFTRDLKVFEGEPGRPAITPELLAGLWVYAFSQG